MKVLPFDPIEVIAMALASVVGRVLGFFAACWIGFAVGGWAAGAGPDGGLLEPLGESGFLASVPAAWFASLWMVLLAPWQAVFLLVVAWFAIRMIGGGGEGGRVRDGGRLAAIEAVRAFLLLAGGEAGGASVLDVVRVLAGVGVLLGGAWAIDWWRALLWERRFRAIEEANREKREARRRRAGGGGSGDAGPGRDAA